MWSAGVKWISLTSHRHPGSPLEGQHWTCTSALPWHVHKELHPALSQKHLRSQHAS